MAREIRGAIRHNGRVFRKGDESDLNGELTAEDYQRLRDAGAITGSWTARKEEAVEEATAPAPKRKAKSKPAPEETEETGTEEKTETGRGNEETTTTVLPDDFPGKPYLVEAGHKTVEAVNALDRDGLIAVKGIGEKTADEILKLRG